MTSSEYSLSSESRSVEVKVTSNAFDEANIASNKMSLRTPEQKGVNVADRVILI